VLKIVENLRAHSGPPDPLAGGEVPGGFCPSQEPHTAVGLLLFGLSPMKNPVEN